ncbi:hypothetical protein ACFPOA_08535 [Lysobacter niabensis]|uniref:hypothetical protein n=1 Tax=Agrilutibacter niabensis TaxID=380628 RepID=UPI00361C09EB
MPAPLLLAPIITAVGAFASRYLFTRLGAWIATALVFLGIELFASAAVVEPLRDKVAAGFAGIPAGLADWMGVLQIDRYATIILSAYAAAMAKKALLRRRTAP